MFNEAFWLVYLANLGAALLGLGAAALFVTLIVALMWTLVLDGDLTTRYRRTIIPMLVVSALITAMGALYPPPTAFYAGATQYVAETAELDDTLMLLKDVIDERIAEELGDAE